MPHHLCWPCFQRPYFYKRKVPGMRNSYQFLGLQETPKSNIAISISLGCLPEVGDRSLLLEMP